MGTLEDRVANIEAQNRRLRFVSLGSLLVAIGIVTLGQAHSDDVPDVLAAKEIRLIRDGNTVIYLGSDPNGGVLVVNDESQRRVGLPGIVWVNSLQFA